MTWPFGIISLLDENHIFFQLIHFFPTNFQEITLHGLLWAWINSYGCHSNLFTFQHCKIWRGGGTCPPAPHSNSAAIHSEEFWIRKVRNHIYTFIHFPHNMMCLYPALFYEIFIKSSMTFSPIYMWYSIYHYFITAKSYNGMKCFLKSQLIYLLDLLII